MNRLAFTRCYLCGAMDRVADGGVGWRRHIINELRDLKIHWLDPTNKPIDIGVEDAASRVARHDEKQRGNYAAVAAEINPIRCVDLRMVDISDFLIVNIDLDVHACGTLEEVFLANRQKKPILVNVVQGKNNAPDWLFGALPSQFIFGGWDDLTDYIRHIAHDPVIETLSRWYFFNWMGEDLEDYSKCQ